MHMAWGLHKEEQFRDLGGNVFEVHFGSEGNWRHVMNNGPWQYDFNVLILKEYEGDKRSSGMIFDKVDIWVRVTDLPPDKRTDTFGKALGNWLGETVKVDVDKDGRAKGNQLRVRVKTSVYEPLVRGFRLKASLKDKIGTWFDFHYEKVPHFCFECGRLVHVGGICEPPLDSSSQWGEWLRASSGRNDNHMEGSQGADGSSSNSRSYARTGEVDAGRSGHKKKEAPTKRNLHEDFARSADQCTGVSQGKERGDSEVKSSNKNNMRNEHP